jgi:hypothetical protein
MQGERSKDKSSLARQAGVEGPEPITLVTHGIVTHDREAHPLQQEIVAEDPKPCSTTHVGC